MHRPHSANHQPHRRFVTFAARLHWMLLLSVTAFVALAMPGCGGCSCNREEDTASQDGQEKESTEEEQEKKKEIPKQDFEIVQGTDVLPRDENSRVRPVKPGHWVQTVQEIRANNFDFYADLQTEIVNKEQQPLGLEGSGYQLRFTRPAAFAKGEPKRVGATYFIPKRADLSSQQAWLGSQLLSRASGREMLDNTELTSRMPGYQYFFVVLAKHPQRYAYLKRLNSISPPTGEFRIESGNPHYRVVLPKVELGQTPLPDSALAWTSIAYVLWDEVEPDQLTVRQQTALVDWLHWGGQLVVDGPNSLEALQSSFLAAYLPAHKGRTVELRQDDLDGLNANWAVAEKQAVRDNARKLDLAAEKLLRIELDMQQGAEYLPGTGQLFAERQIGRGRIVVTAISLASRPFTNWSYRDGFFNACILRRPSRRFVVSNEFSPPQPVWSGLKQLEESPLLTSTLRFFSRDLASPRSETTGVQDLADVWHFGGYQADREAGVGGWNDFSGPAEAARETLKDAAGISTPSAKFVFSLLAVYLVVLVPVNWGFFRLIGRVEWAWIAAPLIAIIGTIVVVRSAQLDIGFVRSRTEIAVLELHGGYIRGHLTRFTALYSSLSTTYEITFEDTDAQAIPFSSDVERNPSNALNVISVRQEASQTMNGYKVRSNSTGILRSEQMQPTKGPIRMVGDDDSGWHVVNGSGFDLRDVGVLRRDASGRATVAWIGSLANDGVARLNFIVPATSRVRLEQWNKFPTTFSIDEQVRELLLKWDRNHDGLLDRDELHSEALLLKHFERADTTRDVTLSGSGFGSLNKSELTRCCRLAREGELRLGRFFDLVSEQLRLGVGEARLLGWTDQPLSGMEIRPRASQTTFRTFVLVHLRGPRPLPAQPDENHPGDVIDESSADRGLLFPESP